MTKDIETHQTQTKLHHANVQQQQSERDHRKRRARPVQSVQFSLVRQAGGGARAGNHNPDLYSRTTPARGRL